MKVWLYEKMLDFIVWHENYLEKWQDFFEWSHYRMLWAAFLKGFILALVLTWIF